jgi:hypothetical protein
MKSIDPGSIRLERAGHVAGHDAIVTRGGRCHLSNGFLNHASQPMTGYSRTSMASCGASSSLSTMALNNPSSACIASSSQANQRPVAPAISFGASGLALKTFTKLRQHKTSDVQDPAIQEHTALQSARPGISSNNLRSADSIVKISA